MSNRNDGQAGAENQETEAVTPAMVRAGVLEAREHPLGGSLEDLVRDVFIAMQLERSD